MNPTLMAPSVALALALGLALAAGSATAAKCIDDEPSEIRPDTGETASSSAADSPRVRLQTMVQEALRRSNAVGAASLLAAAAQSDVSEVRAAALPQASVSGVLAHIGSQVSGQTLSQSSGLQARATINVGAPLYDGGRLSELTNWRTSLAEAARQGQLSAQEQVALQTVSLALERSRYRLQAQVYQQYARKMSCLVEALDQIVSADKGRASELVQARKTQQQAELAYAAAVSSVRQVELRLRRFVGDGLPSANGMSAVLASVPNLSDAQAEAALASEIVQLDAQADAADSYAKAVATGQKPQIGWLMSGSKSAGAAAQGSWTAGVTLSIPLINPGLEHSVSAATKRAEAARLQRADALEARASRVADVHEQANAALDRARRVVDILRDSNQVRNFTLQQWQQLGRRSLFDVMASESEHYNLRIQYVNALFDGQQSNAQIWSLGRGIEGWLR